MQLARPTGDAWRVARSFRRWALRMVQGVAKHARLEQVIASVGF